MSQEIFIELLPEESYVDPGVWLITLYPEKIVDGAYEMWLPGGALRNTATRFLYGTPSLTLTIPSTASRALSVGAYDSTLTAMADFSGRGSDRGCWPYGSGSAGGQYSDCRCWRRLYFCNRNILCNAFCSRKRGIADGMGDRSGKQSVFVRRNA